MNTRALDETIGALATPPGEGGIHVIRLSGPKSPAIAARLFHAPSGTPADALEPYKVYFGEIRDPADARPVDEVLLILFRAPHSYTREDVVEIHCHGGMHVASKILRLALDAGARLAAPGEFTRRAFLNGRLDLTQAEAVADIIHAASDKALSAALAQLKGRLSAKLQDWYDRLVAVLSPIEAAIDFPEEGLEFQTRRSLEQQVAEVQKEIAELMATYRQGKIYREGMKVAIVGKPNVGKSSLLNALLREDRAIVTPLPGTTRDVIEERVQIRDIHITIVDTAGLRHPPEVIEAAGIERTRAALAAADLGLMVFDGSRPLDADDEVLIQDIGDKPRLVVINKSDLPPALDPQTIKAQLDVSEAFALSATDGTGLDRLRDALYDTALQGRTSGEALVLTRERHRQALDRAHQSLERLRQSLNENLSEDLLAVDLNMALEELGGLLGKNFVEDMLDRIFEEFCIGK